MGKTKGGGTGSGRVTLSWEKGKFVSKSKVRQLSCRYCKKSLAAQNYARHLQTAHKDDWDANPGDLREFGDRAISFFHPARSAEVPQSEAGGADGGVEVGSEEHLGGSADTHPGEDQDMQDGSEKDHDDDLPDPDDSLDLEYLNSPRSQSRRNSGSSSEDENARQRIEHDVGVSDQEGGRSRNRSPELTELRLIEGKVDEILKKQNIESPAFPETSSEKRVLQKLEIIKAGIDVNDTVKDVKNVADTLSRLFVVDEDTEERDDTGSEDLFLHCRSIQEIEIKAAEFKFRDGYMECLVCESKFKYGSDQPREFDIGGIQSQKFRSLKKSLRRHLQTGKHSEMLRKAEAAEEIEFKETNRNKKIGRTLGRCIYKGLYTGSAQSLYPVDVAMLAKEGVDCGEMNHSRDYAAKLGDCIGEVVQTRVAEFLSSALPQTGLRPPCKVVADKATHKHWSNNLTGVLTIVPGSDQLIQGIFLDAPRCERSTGDALSEDIRKTLAKYKVSPCQVTGLAGDGAYTHCSVGKKLDELLGVFGFHDTDFAHIAARIEINARARHEFQWVTAFVLIVSKTNKLINWGQAWHIFFKTVKAMQEDGYDITVRVPRMMSDTRFPNYVSMVFSVLRESWPALVSVMQKLVELGIDGTAKQKERARDAEALQGNIFNTRFTLRLSFLTDVYNTFGFGVNCLQVVNSLPFDKLDVFNKGVIERYDNMVKTIDPANCACSNYVKKDGKVYKVMNEEEVTVSAMDSNNNEEEYLDRGAAQNNTMPEDCMMQLDGLNDEDSDGDMYDSDTDVVRPNIFTSQYYLDNLSETSSVAPPPQPNVTTTQDYLDALSDSDFSSAPGLPNNDVDCEDDPEENHDPAVAAEELRYIQADIKVTEGKRVFTVKVEKKTQEEYCYFPNSHQDLREMRTFGTYRGYPVGSLLPAPVNSATRSGRKQQGINVLLNSEDIIKEVQTKIVDLIEHLKTELSEKVFTDQTKAMIENTRTVLDVQSLFKKLVSRSSTGLANILYQSFRAASIVIDPNLFIDIIDEAEYRAQYREYLKKLKIMVDEKSEMKGWDSLKILTKLFKSPEFSLNIEAIMGILARAMVTIGIESVVESWVSIMESHNSKNRPLGEKMIVTETAVHINGPNPVNCDSVVDQANKLYWGKSKLRNAANGHFIRTSQNPINWKVSKSVDKVASVKAKLPFMM